MKISLTIIFFTLLVGCVQKQQLPADVTGELIPINKSQVIDYER
jgi:hypothetical protein